MAQALRSVLTDTNLAARLGTRARRTVEAKYSVAHVAEQWLRTYHDVLAR